MARKAFDFVHRVERPEKPRKTGITEIRAPKGVGPRHLRDKLEMLGDYVDIVKFGGGSPALLDREAMENLIDICHEHEAMVKLAGFFEVVILKHPNMVEDYIQEAKDLGFDYIEISDGYLSIDQERLIELTNLVQEHELRPAPEIGTKGQGIKGSPVHLPNIDKHIADCKKFLDAGAEKITIEEDGVTEARDKTTKPPDEWRTDYIFKIACEIGIENLLFEASDRDVFAWYISNFGPNVNLMVDHSHLDRLERYRSGIWGVDLYTA